MLHDMPCHVEPLEPDPDSEALQAAEILYLAVAGMGCPNCASRVRNALLQTPGVVNAEVDHQASVAEVWVDAGTVEPLQLCSAVARAGEGTHHEYIAVPIPRRDPGREKAQVPGRTPRTDPLDTENDMSDVRDPVCGMRVSPGSAAATATFEGKTYHFCCDACREAFEEDPKRYVGGD